MEGSGLDNMEGEKGYPWVEQRKKETPKEERICIPEILYELRWENLSSLL